MADAIERSNFQGLATDPALTGDQAMRTLNCVPVSPSGVRCRWGCEEIQKYAPGITGRIDIVDACPDDLENGVLIISVNAYFNNAGRIVHEIEGLFRFIPSRTADQYSTVQGTNLGPKIYGVFDNSAQVFDYLLNTYSPLDPDTLAGGTFWFANYIRQGTYDESGWGDTIYTYPKGLIVMTAFRTVPDRIITQVYDAETLETVDDIRLFFSSQTEIGAISPKGAFDVGVSPLGSPFNGYFLWWNEDDGSIYSYILINGNFDITDLNGTGTALFLIPNTDAFSGAPVADVSPLMKTKTPSFLVGKYDTTDGVVPGEKYQVVAISQDQDSPIGGATNIGYTTVAAKNFTQDSWPGWDDRPDSCLNVQQIPFGSDINKGQIVALLGNWETPDVCKILSNPRIVLLNGPLQSGDFTSTALDIVESHATGIGTGAMLATAYAAASAGEPSGSTIDWGITGSTSTSDPIAAAEKTVYLQASDFGFDIPNGAVIDLITVSLVRHTDGSSTSLKDNVVKLLVAGVPTGTSLPNADFWTAGFFPVTYSGSPADWGVTVDGSDINDTGFGFALSVVNDGAATTVATVFNVTITVVYDGGNYQAHGMAVSGHGFAYLAGTGDFVNQIPARLITKYNPFMLNYSYAFVDHLSNGLGDFYADPLDTKICNPMIDGGYFMVQDVDTEKTRVFIYDLDLNFIAKYVVGTQATQAEVGATAANVDNAGAAAWTPSNSPGRGVLSTTLDFGDGSDYLFITNFGFTLPVGSFVNGVTAAITRSSSVETAIADTDIQLVVSGSRAGDNLASGPLWPTGSTVKTYGGSTNLWGNDLTRAIVNASDFGIAIAVQNQGNDGALPTVSTVTLTVHYSDGVDMVGNKYSTKFFAQAY